MKPLTWKVADDFEDTGQTAAVEEVEIAGPSVGLPGEETRSRRFGSEEGPGPVYHRSGSLPGCPGSQHGRRWSDGRPRWSGPAPSSTGRRDFCPAAISQEDYELSVAQVKVNEAEVKQAQANLKRAQLDLGWTEIQRPLRWPYRQVQFLRRRLDSHGRSRRRHRARHDRQHGHHASLFQRARAHDARLSAARRARPALDGRPDHVKDWKAPVFTGLANEKGYPHEGVLDFIDNRVDSRTGTIRSCADCSTTPSVCSRRACSSASAFRWATRTRRAGARRGDRHRSGSEIRFGRG